MMNSQSLKRTTRQNSEVLPNLCTELNEGQKHCCPFEIKVNAKTKNVNNPNDAFPTEKCCDSIKEATIQYRAWQDICDSVTKDALRNCSRNVDKPFKV